MTVARTDSIPLGPQENYTFSAPGRWSYAPGRRCGEFSSSTRFQNPGFFFLRVSQQGPCLTAIGEDGGDKRLAQLELACKADGIRVPFTFLGCCLYKQESISFSPSASQDRREDAQMCPFFSDALSTVSSRILPDVSTATARRGATPPQALTSLADCWRLLTTCLSPLVSSHRALER